MTFNVNLQATERRPQSCYEAEMGLDRSAVGCSGDWSAWYRAVGGGSGGRTRRMEVMATAGPLNSGASREKRRGKSGEDGWANGRT
jgi:hypothetical protein